MKYLCTLKKGIKQYKWMGKMKLIKNNGQFMEIEIRGRGKSFYVITGKYNYGNFICIPNFNVGCQLADYSNVLWNQSQLCRNMEREDAATIACALNCIKEL